MDATQMAGVLAFGAAALACLISRTQGSLGLGAANACFAAECALGWRHGLHDAAIALLGAYYPERGPLQILVTTAVLLAAILAIRSATRPLRSMEMPLPVIATGLAFALFAVETVSLHAIDRLLYHPAGSLLIIGWLWIALGAATAAGALAKRRLRARR